MPKIARTYRIEQETDAAIKKAAKLTGSSEASVIDAWANPPTVVVGAGAREILDAVGTHPKADGPGAILKTPMGKIAVNEDTVRMARALADRSGSKPIPRPGDKKR